MTTENVNEGGGENSTSLSLLLRVQNNDAEAWSRFVALYDPLVRHWVARQGLGEPHVSDVSQEVFLTVSKRLGQFKKTSPQHSFRAWLRTVTRSRIGDYRRQQLKQPPPVGGTDAQIAIADVPDERNEDSNEYEDTEKMIVYRRAVDLIKTDFELSTWTAFWRVVVDGVAASDVASELQMTRNAVHLAKAHVLKRLREEFLELVDF